MQAPAFAARCMKKSPGTDQALLVGKRDRAAAIHAASAASVRPKPLTDRHDQSAGRARLR